MIGYYVHHRGSGHLHRALAVASEMDAAVTILSSLPRPASWTGGWVQLPLDTDADPVDVTAGGALHWVPLDSAGLSDRMSAISHWLAEYRPTTVVVDVSVEVSALVRLHGIRVVTYAQPGDRRDAAHNFGYQMASAIIAPWPTEFRPSEVAQTVAQNLVHVGSISRFRVSPTLQRPDPGLLRIAVMNGSGGRGQSALETVVAEAQAAVPGAVWVWLIGKSSDQIEHELRSVSLVFAHCGQNAVAEIAACRTPAILVPEDRPHEEQHQFASAISTSDFPAVVCNPGEGVDWASIISHAHSLDGQRWSHFVDGRAAERAAAVISRVAASAHRGPGWKAA
ncbi:glycosyltransferase [Lacisediminihabitans sp. H27-G8]|uniref:glycosyltransferase n=1 Tax=Lacisediminihabitans sp. H27-G8 TaxID=3111909 RepID=UPI0038FCE3EE